MNELELIVRLIYYAFGIAVAIVTLYKFAKKR
jgi:hypothetical protein